ncbi:MAG: hypothetical protein ABL966_13815 [Acidimicrobiales bacterium]
MRQQPSPLPLVTLEDLAASAPVPAPQPVGARPQFRPGLAEPVAAPADEPPANGLAQPRLLGRPRRTRPLRAT